MASYTGSPCKKCGTTTRAVSTGACLKCNREYQKTFLSANPGKTKEYALRARQKRVAIAEAQANAAT